MSIEGILALIVVILIMAAIGYLLARLAQPVTDPPGEADADTKPAQTDKNSEIPGKLAETRSASVHPPVTQPATRSPPPEAQLIDAVNRCLPQTQCAQCGHPGCRPYAEAIIRDNAPINQCPPGGTALIEELATLLGTEVLPLDEGKGQTKPPQLAFIREADCIGCTLCIAACPVDAIVGAARFMHTVIIDQCTGCELCLPPCPVDCIELHPLETPLHRWQWPKPA